MNKKRNTILFTIGATVFNLLTMAILFIVPLAVLLAIFRERVLNVLPIVGLVLFFTALIANFFIYGYVMRKISEKFNMDEYFEPLFKKKKDQ